MPKIFVGEPFSVSLISDMEKFYASKGYVTIFRRKFFVSKYRNISSRNHSMLCFRKILVVRKFMDKRGGGGNQDFPSKIFCLTAPKNFIGEPFCVSESFGYRKILWIRGGEEGRDGVSPFTVENFLSHGA